MKIISSIIGLFCWAYGQAQMIQLTTHQTTSLIFPFPIQHVDRGSAQIMVQPVPEAPHILLVKAASVDFPATNLTVITTDGSTYALAMQYAVTPAQWVYKLESRQQPSISTRANNLVDNPRTQRGMKDHSAGIQVRVTGIYIHHQVIFYQLQLHNNSPIEYDIDGLRFFIRDQRKSKRTASQELEIFPQYIAGNTRQVKANTPQSIVVALEKFTLPDAKYFAIQLMEKNGGRHLLIKVRNRKIVQAIPLSDLK